MDTNQLARSAVAKRVTNSAVKAQTAKEAKSNNSSQQTQSNNSSDSNVRDSNVKVSNASREEINQQIKDAGSQDAIKERRDQNKDQGILGTIGDVARGIGDAYNGVLDNVGTGIDDAWDSTIGGAIKDATGIDTTNWMNGEDVGNVLDTAVQIGSMFVPGGAVAKAASVGLALMSNAGELANAAQGVNEYGDKLSDGQRIAALASGALGTGLAATGAGKIGSVAKTGARDSLGTGVAALTDGSAAADKLMSGENLATKAAGKISNLADKAQDISGTAKELAEGAKGKLGNIKEAPGDIKDTLSNIKELPGKAKDKLDDIALKGESNEVQNTLERATKIKELQQASAKGKGVSNLGDKLSGSNILKGNRALAGKQTNKDILEDLVKGDNLSLETLSLAEERGILDLNKINEAADKVLAKNPNAAIDAEQLIKEGLSSDFAKAYDAVANGTKADKATKELLSDKGIKKGSGLANAIKEGVGGTALGGVNALAAYIGNGGNIEDVDTSALATQIGAQALMNRLGSRRVSRLINKAARNNLNNAGIRNNYASTLAALKSGQLGSNITKDQYGATNVLFGADADTSSSDTSSSNQSDSDNDDVIINYTGSTSDYTGAPVNEEAMEAAIANYYGD